MTTCDRCGGAASTHITSMFNTQTICTDCKTAEQAHERYAEAVEAESEAVRAGNYNFPGIGLPADLIPRRVHVILEDPAHQKYLANSGPHVSWGFKTPDPQNTYALLLAMSLSGRITICRGVPTDAEYALIWKWQNRLSADHPTQLAYCEDCGLTIRGVQSLRASTVEHTIHRDLDGVLCPGTGKSGRFSMHPYACVARINDGVLYDHLNKVVSHLTPAGIEQVTALMPWVIVTDQMA